MSYQQNLTELITSVQNTKIATDILQYMQRVRNNTEPNFVRRLCFELLQNTMDCAYEDQATEIEIVSNMDNFIYKHNSKPFRSKDILSLTNQVTSKADDENTVGKFGTGFATTMQLSPIVEVTSVLHDENEEYKPFTVSLDRSSETAEGIINNINTAIVSLLKVDENSPVDYDSNALNTVFSYSLTTAAARKVAAQCLETFETMLPITMAFNTSLKKVCVNGKTYESSFNESYGYRTVTVSIDGTERRFIVQINKTDELLVEYNDNKKILPIGNDVSRLFVKYPLIGSQTFPFPVIINSLNFLPNEPRSNISLADSDTATESNVNKDIIQKAISHFEEFILHLAEEGYCSLENMIELPDYKGSDYHSLNFINSNIKHHLFKIVSTKNIVTLSDGSITTLGDKKLYIPTGSENTQPVIEELLGKDSSLRIPTSGNSWFRILRNYGDLELKYVTVKTLLEHKYHLDIDECVYANTLLTICDDQDRRDIIAGAYEIIPTRDRSLHKFTEVYLMGTIPEDIVSVFESSSLFYNLKLSKILVHPDINSNILETLGVKTYNLNDFFSSVKDAYALRNFQYDSHNKYNLLNSMINYLSPKARSLMGADKKDTLPFFNSDVLTILDNWVLQYFVNSYNNKKAVQENEIDFINIILTQLYETGCPINLYSYSIFPTQDLSLHALNDVKFNEVAYDELFDLHEALGLGTFERTLVHDSIIKPSNADVLTDRHLISAIDQFYTEVFLTKQADVNTLSEKQRGASLQLYNFLNKHPDIAALSSVFKDEKQRLRLLDLDVVKKLNEKASAFDILCEKLGKNPEEIMKKIQEIGENSGLSLLEELLPEEIMNGLRQSNTIYSYDVQAPFDDLPETWRAYLLSNPDAKDEYMHRIGKIGEDGAYKYLCDKYGEANVTRMPDRNPGYDFEVMIGTEVNYFEVKTHTPTSVHADTIRLKKEQYIKYIHNRSNYAILLMTAYLRDLDHQYADCHRELFPFDETEVSPMMKEYWYYIKNP